jgi:solute carrier family 25 (mitochondrial phosphate transporter), member 23/24/25/41
VLKADVPRGCSLCVCGTTKEGLGSKAGAASLTVCVCAYAHCYADHDGRITQKELQIGLSHMVVTCPNSRCCYRTKRACASALCSGSAPVLRKPMSFCDFRRHFLLLPQNDMIVEYWLRAGHPSCCDVGCPIQYHEHLERKTGSSPWGHLLAGTIAGAASRTATAPLEVRSPLHIWLRFSTSQVGPCCACMAASERRQSDTRCLLIRPGFADRHHSVPIWGPVTDLHTCVPLQTLRIMAMTGTLERGKSGVTSGAGRMVGAASDLVRRHGWGSLYRGNIANVTRSAPQKALDFFAFDMFKNALSSPRPASPLSRKPAVSSGKQQQPGTAATLAAAGLAGALSSTVLYPLEVVRRQFSD